MSEEEIKDKIKDFFRKMFFDNLKMKISDGFVTGSLFRILMLNILFKYRIIYKDLIIS